MKSGSRLGILSGHRAAVPLNIPSSLRNIYHPGRRVIYDH